ncbi:AAA family ATPase [Paenibacillus sp. strain BS8-2]
MAAKVSIVCEEQRITQQMVQRLNFMNIPIGEIIDKPKEAYTSLNAKEARVIVLVEPSDREALPSLLQQMKRMNDTAPIIYLSKSESFDLLRTMYRQGISEWIRYPEEMDEFEKVLERALDQQKHQERQKEKTVSSLESQGCKVVTIYSGKGGVGTSFIASNLAQSLAHRFPNRVLLIDFNLQYGGVDMLMDIKHDRTIGDLKSVMKELTHSQINNVLYKREDSQLHVLVSPKHPQEAEQFKGEDIEGIIKACRGHYDYIVLDIPKEMNEISIGALGQTSLLYYVTELDRPGISRMQNVLQLLDRYHLIKDDSIEILVNRFSKKRDVQLDELRKMTTYPVAGTITDHFKSIQSHINLGEPLLKSDSDKGRKGPARDIWQLTNELLKRIGGEALVHLPKAK